MTEPVLLVAKSDGVATLTLNRPAKMNAPSRELRAAITQAFQALAGDTEAGMSRTSTAHRRAGIQARGRSPAS